MEKPNTVANACTFPLISNFDHVLIDGLMTARTKIFLSNRNIAGIRDNHTGVVIPDFACSLSIESRWNFDI